MIERHHSIDPVHPGEILREDILPALSMSKTAVAAALGVSRQTLYDILNEQQPVTAEMAVRFGSCSATARDSGRICNAAMTWQSRSAWWTFPGYQPWWFVDRWRPALGATEHRLPDATGPRPFEGMMPASQ